ncbi:MAG TPA: SRPBCC domain-containing protein [Puia sp.]|jgi:hypothetical protein|nr:SRPBCC domain-containing protein [Puia sp.]
MENQNYQATITVSQSANEVFKSINSVSKWWMENLEGDSENLNGKFTVDFGDDNFVTHKLVEVIPNKKVVWLVTDCYLSWFKDKTEWTNTKMSFEISTKGNSTVINFTHIGLIPEVECYDMCVKGWDQYVKGSLFKLITEGTGLPQKKK